jgi:hypothetical protein
MVDFDDLKKISLPSFSWIETSKTPSVCGFSPMVGECPFALQHERVMITPA